MKKIVLAEIFCFVAFCFIAIMVAAGAIDPNLGVKNEHSIPVHIVVNGPDAPLDHAPSAPSKPTAPEAPVSKQTPVAKKLVVGESTSGKIPTLNRSEEHGPVVVKSDNEDNMFYSSEHTRPIREVRVKSEP